MKTKEQIADEIINHFLKKGATVSKEDYYYIISLLTNGKDKENINLLNQEEVFNELENEINQEYFIIEDDGTKKTSELLDECGGLFPVWSHYPNEKLDEDFPPVKTKFKYRKRVEADEELKNMSAEELDEKGIKGITLRERLIMELKYFKETGGHLDIENMTLCTGSRDGDGLVPVVDWYDGGMFVGWGFPRDARGNFRARQQFPL